MKRLSYWTLATISIVGMIMSYNVLGWVQFFGWVYSIAFALSAIPEAAASLKKGKVNISDGTLLLWIIGEIGGIIYGIGLGQLPLIFNCGFNALFVGIICKYRLYPREKEKDVK